MVSGHMLGKYRVEKVIGKGGMGTVYLARHSLLDNRVAIKVLSHEITSRPELVKRFFLEAKAVAQLSDPGLPHLYDYGHAEDGRAYMAMEYLEGETLRARLKRCGPLDEVAFLRLSAQVARSLATVHGQGVVHRDLKPDNIFIVKDSSAAGGESSKVLDFGVAKLTKLNPGEAALTQATELLGTPYYMAPEQWQGAHMVDTRADIYSLGCIMYCCLCGQVPFVGDSIGKICAGHIVEQPKPLTELRASISQQVNELVLHCLAKEPNDRPASMKELAEQIDACLGELEGASNKGQPKAAGETPAVEQKPAPPRPADKTSSAKRPPAPPSRRGKAAKAEQKPAPARKSRKAQSVKQPAAAERQVSASSVERQAGASSGARQASASSVEEQSTVAMDASELLGAEEQSTVAVNASELLSAELRPSSPEFGGFDSTVALPDFEAAQLAAKEAAPLKPPLTERETVPLKPIAPEREIVPLKPVLASKETVRLDSMTEALASHLGGDDVYNPFPEPPTEDLERPSAWDGDRVSRHSWPEPPTQELPMSDSWGGASGYIRGRSGPESAPASQRASMPGQGPPSFDETTPPALVQSIDIIKHLKRFKGSPSARKRFVALAAAAALMLCAGGVWFVAGRPGGSIWSPDGKETDTSQLKPPEPQSTADPEPQKREPPELSPTPSADRDDDAPPLDSAEPDSSAEPEPSAEPAELTEKDELSRKMQEGRASKKELRKLLGICIKEGDQRCINLVDARLKPPPPPPPKPPDIYPDF